MATEKRLIDANALRTQFDDIPPFIGLTGGCVQQYIDKAPTVDAVEVVHGRWLPKMLVGGFAEEWGYVCSCCGCVVSERSGLGQYKDNNQQLNYCPNCGAKNGEEDSGC